LTSSKRLHAVGLRKQSAPESARTQAIPHASEAGQIFQPLTPTVLSEDQRRFV